MIKRYVFGNPIDTEAVVKAVTPEEGVPAGWGIDEASHQIRRKMSETDVV